ncbi:TetR/AcrR family transcriptional regulator [Microvirga rosea]|uniref:TetR/AcrR family transcriptional regulator n=1 Tax=Microvirga rosea TaxID=2715425 RepID=UPI001D0B9476|nr:TetR/AcrR family transcriptional regulator [Microvirga rosea]MCB8819882.1 TetR/AcrR family transcriptional regulator [Microvirga rosea]
MVQKRQDAERKRRGRPRAYDPETALHRAMEAFWSAGYSGTSLDDIASATGMNRPSLYAAFGDKHDLYVKALAHYWSQGFEAMREALAGKRPLREELMSVYDGSLSLYFSGEGPARGCFAIGTATTEAVLHPEIRAAFSGGLRILDKAFEDRMRAAQVAGELSPDADIETLAMVASSTLHTIAIRARMGTARAELRRLARKAVGLICGFSLGRTSPSSTA